MTAARAHRPPAALVGDVVRVCAEVLRLDGIAPDTDLWELGLDSLAAVDLAAGCSGLGWGTLEPTELIGAVTPTAIAAVLQAQAAATYVSRDSDVVVLTATGTRPPVVAFPGAGSSALAFRWLARTLGADRPFVVVEAHGLNTPGAPDRTVAAQADRGAVAVAAGFPTGPVVLLGHSAGGAVAHEVARRLAAAGRSPRVVLLDAVIPGFGTRPAPGRRLRSALAGLPDRLRLARRVRHPGPPALDPRRFAAFTVIGVRALAGYRPGPADFPVWHFRVAGSDAGRGWPPDLPGGEVPGEHLTMLTPPHVEVLAERIVAAVDAP